VYVEADRVDDICRRYAGRLELAATLQIELDPNNGFRL